MDFIIHILILVFIYSFLTISLNLISGYSGLVSIAHAAFFGVGAYSSALITLNYQCTFLVNIISVILLSCIFGAIIGVSSLKLGGDKFVITTFAFQIITFDILNNWVSFTGGPLGLAGVPRPIIFGYVISSNLSFLIFISIFAAIIFIVTKIIVESPFGRVLKVIREDEIFALASGKNVALYKMLVFIIGAGMASLAGVMYVHYISFIDPSSFDVMESIFIISIVIIGGAGSLWGPVVGALVLVSLPEVLRFIGMPSSIAAIVRQILYGGALVAFMLWRPQGLLGKYAFRSGEAGA